MSYYCYVGDLLPLCTEQCTKISEAVDKCNPEFDTLLRSNLTTGPQLADVLQLTTEPNCSYPDSDYTPVSQEDCISLTVYCEFTVPYMYK